ncbi:MAG: saccharopine dehydrogenase family protein [Gammaproteobacteria bacterium]
MHHILILGAGRIGILIAHLLQENGNYTAYLGDIKARKGVIALDVTNPLAISDYLKNNTAIGTIISCLPYYHNPLVAELARTHCLNYFDLTEDIEVTRYVKELAENADQAFVPQCGLAPGIVNIIAAHLIQSDPQTKTAKLRVGALPITANNALHYALTWSTEGLINQYGNPCLAIRNSELAVLQPLEDLEVLEIDGAVYEAFNTSGGLGSMTGGYVGKIDELDYKTLRYPGHCEKMRFLMQDLKLNTDRKVLKHILERVLPKTIEDFIVISVSTDTKQYVKKFNYLSPWSAIQMTTATGLCTVLDLVLSQPGQYKGFVNQYDFNWVDIVENCFGKYFAEIA